MSSRRDIQSLIEKIYGRSRSWTWWMEQKEKNLFRLRFNKKGSYIVEAAMSMPVFILCIVAIALIINIISICENIGFCNAKEMHEVAAAAYVSDAARSVAGSRGTGVSTAGSVDSAPAADSAASGASGAADAAARRLSLQSSVAAANPKVGKYKVTNFKYRYTDGEISDLIAMSSKADFRVANPIGINGNITFTQSILSRAFVGKTEDADPLPISEFQKNADSCTVVIFPKYGIKFHSTSCRYVKQEYEGDEYKLSMERDDAEAKGYKACSICNGGKS